MSRPIVMERPLFENAWEVEPGPYRILLPLPWDVPFVNAYVVTSRNEWVLIDCGLNWPPSLRALGHSLKAIGVRKGGLTYPLLTHRHPDHSGADGPLRVGDLEFEVLLTPGHAAGHIMLREPRKGWPFEADQVERRNKSGAYPCREAPPVYHLADSAVCTALRSRCTVRRPREAKRGSCVCPFTQR